MPEATSAEARERARLRMLDERSLRELDRLKHDKIFWDGLLKEKRRLERALDRQSDPDTHSLNYRPFLGTSPLPLMQEINELHIDQTGRPVFSAAGRPLSPEEVVAYTHEGLTDPLEIIRARHEARETAKQTSASQPPPLNPYSAEAQQQRMDTEIFQPEKAQQVQDWFNAVMPRFGWRPFKMDPGTVPYPLMLAMANNVKDHIIQEWSHADALPHQLVPELMELPQRLSWDEMTPEQIEFYQSPASQEQVRQMQGSLDSFLEVRPGDPPGHGVYIPTAATPTPTADQPPELALPLGPKLTDPTETPFLSSRGVGGR